MPGTRYSMDTLPDLDLELNEYQKTKTVMAAPIKGPGVFSSSEGRIEVPDTWEGWVAIDDNGYPYPIAKDIFEATYEEVTDGKDK